jgi:hypothetical protein
MDNDPRVAAIVAAAKAEDCDYGARAQCTSRHPDKPWFWCAPCLARELAALSAVPVPAPTAEEAFKAGYHCRWHKAQGAYCFDPAMSPGDSDGAFAAWLSQAGSLHCADFVSKGTP